jgi:hypothetical protein
MVFDLSNNVNWSEEVISSARLYWERLDYQEQKSFNLDFVERIIRRISLFSEECPDCQELKKNLAKASQLVCQPSSDHTQKGEYLNQLNKVTKHLKKDHKLITERYYVKRLVSIAAVVGAAMVGLIFFLVSSGITLITMTAAWLVSIGRLFTSFIFGLYMDWRAKKKERLI